MLKRLIYGDPNRPDAEGLPTPEKRRKLFKQQLSIHFLSMIFPCLVCFAFSLPALVWTELTVRAVPLTEAGLADLSSSAFITTYLVGLAVGILVTGPAMAGFSLLMRNWARGEHASRWSTFFGGMKRNWKQGLLCSFLSGLLPLFAYSALNYYGNLGQTSSLWYLIPFALCALVCIFWLLIRQLIYMMIDTYALPFHTLVKNALLVSILELPKSLLVLLLSALPLGVFALLLYLLPSRMGLTVVVGFAYYAFIGIALERFLFASFANYACEKHINPRIPGARVDIGLTTEREVSIDDAQPASDGAADAESLPDETN